MPAIETTTSVNHEPVSPKLNEIARQIVSSAFEVHRNLGPGLLESIYETCFCHELNKIGLAFQRKVEVPIIYDGMKLVGGLRLDVLVENLIICELKAVEDPNPVYVAQLITQLKLCSKRLGFLINFNVPLIKDGIKRIVL